jgi:hypothetical protein
MVDGKKLTMGYLYQSWIALRPLMIIGTYRANQNKYMPLWEIIDDRWTNKLIHRRKWIVFHHEFNQNKK